ESGDTLPGGVTFNPATGVLAGTPAAGTGRTYHLLFTAHNGVGSDAAQSFTLTVNQAPAIPSGPSAAFTEAVASTFTVTATGTPATQSFTLVVSPAGFAYDPATRNLTITASAAQNNVSMSQSTTQDAAGNLHTTYTFTLDGGTQSFTDAQLAKVSVHGAASVK